MFAHLSQHNPGARLVLVGEGNLLRPMRELVLARGLGEHILFTGRRSDVPRLMRGAFDVFVLPSLQEGLPLVGVEAQAAGLPCLLSAAITPEIEIVPGLVCRLPLAKSPLVWAEAVLRMHQTPLALGPTECLARVRNSPFNIEIGVRQLEAVYTSAAPRWVPATYETAIGQPGC